MIYLPGWRESGWTLKQRNQSDDTLLRAGYLSHLACHAGPGI
jgi:hypothetical protein